MTGGGRGDKLIGYDGLRRLGRKQPALKGF